MSKGDVDPGFSVDVDSNGVPVPTPIPNDCGKCIIKTFPCGEDWLRCEAKYCPEFVKKLCISGMTKGGVPQKPILKLSEVAATAAERDMSLPEEFHYASGCGGKKCSPGSEDSQEDQRLGTPFTSPGSGVVGDSASPVHPTLKVCFIECTEDGCPTCCPKVIADCAPCFCNTTDPMPKGIPGKTKPFYPPMLCKWCYTKPAPGENGPVPIGQPVAKLIPGCPERSPCPKWCFTKPAVPAKPYKDVFYMNGLGLSLDDPLAGMPAAMDKVRAKAAATSSFVEERVAVRLAACANKTKNAREYSSKFGGVQLNAVFLSTPPVNLCHHHPLPPHCRSGPDGEGTANLAYRASCVYSQACRDRKAMRYDTGNISLGRMYT